MEPEKEAEHVHDENCGHGEPAQPIVRATPKVGRNDPCPCGSGSKFKKCCMNKSAGVTSPAEAPRPAEAPNPASPPAERSSRNTFSKAADKSGDFRTRPGRRRP